VDNQKYQGKHQQKVNACGRYMEREPRSQPYADKQEEQKQENQICDNSHK
jgi:hypothetical protein